MRRRYNQADLKFSSARTRFVDDQLRVDPIIHKTIENLSYGMNEGYKRVLVNVAVMVEFLGSGVI